MDDPRSIAGKTLPIDEETELLVVGAGVAGLAAALEAAALGVRVVLAEEHPVAPETMGLDVPLHFGGRAEGSVRNRTAMLEALLAARPEIERAFEAGVDVRLGTSVWGLWSNGATVGWLPGVVAGLMAEAKASLLRAARVIVATGRRDMGLAFPGWEMPGVMGGHAAEVLLRCYGALAARTVAVLGTTTETVAACRALQGSGLQVAAVIEQASEPADPMIYELGVPLLLGHAPRQAVGGANGVEALVVGPVAADGRQLPGGDRRLRCDAVLLGVGTVPQIELLHALDARVGFDAARGGHVPILDAGGQSSVPGVYAAGDCAGVWPAKTRDPRLAELEGRSAARRVARSLGRAAAGETIPPPPPPAGELAEYRLGWVRACAIEAADPHIETFVCQCESVTARDILEVRPPRYLGCSARGNTAHDLRSLLPDGPPNPDQVKRLTRAGMGLCQGRRCREQVAALLALATGAALESVPLATHRAPVRPLPLALAAAATEPADMTEQWDTWFGMRTQYLPPWEVAPTYTARPPPRASKGEVSSE